MAMEMTDTGKTVLRRTYLRAGEETWDDVVGRVVKGNLALAPKIDGAIEDGEGKKLASLMTDGKIIPAGRQLYMTGVDGRQFLFNCHVSGWDARLSSHFEFTFMRLMEGGGVGANYSSTFNYNVWRPCRTKLYCDPQHPDYEELKPYIQKEMYIGAPSRTLLLAVDDSREGWAAALTGIIDAATEYNSKFPNGKRFYDSESGQDDIVLYFDLSHIRASGSMIKTFGGTAAGPVPLAKLLKGVEEVLNSAWLSAGLTFQDMMEIDHLISECVISGNVRRSARMSVMKWDDPGILDFVRIKADTSAHWSTNISVAIDNRFIKFVNDDTVLSSQEREEAILARNVYRKICDGMLKNGEPGIWNYSKSQIGEAGEIVATNPCGEIPLQEWEACNLGHVNLAAFVDSKGNYDLAGLIEAHRLMTRFLIRSTFGDIQDPKQREVMDRNRRIGVGHLGYQWFMNLRGVKYSEAWTTGWIRALEMLGDTVRRQAQAYAFKLRIPEPIKVTTVAPTGSIAKLFGVSEGIHPIYAKYFIRRIRFSTVDADQVRQIEEYRQRGYAVLNDIYSPNTAVVEIPTRDPLLERVGEAVVESAEEISITDMLDTLCRYQQFYVDNAVSFTINFPEGEYTVNELMEILKPYLAQVKGITLMPDGTRPMAPYERISREQYEEYIEFLEDHAIASESFGDGSCATGACPVR